MSNERRFYLLKDNSFRHAEKCLYEYKRNLACLEVLKQDLQVLKNSDDVHAQNYEVPFNKNSQPSDPVASRVEKIEAIERRIKQVERWTKPVERLEKDLNSPEVLENSHNKDLLQILKLFYFGKNSVNAVIDEMALGRTTFFNYRHELVIMAINYFGF